MKRSSMKLLTSFLLAVIIVVSAFSAMAFGAAAAEEDGAVNSTVYKKVTDLSELEVGSKVIIVAAEYDFALSTEQKSSNRGDTGVAKLQDGLFIIPGENVQILTLAAGTQADTLAFYTGEGYLYASSGSSNQLKTNKELDDNGSWDISIDENGISTLIAKATNTRNVMQYNSGSNLFACYASASQKAISIYKLNDCQHENTEDIGEYVDSDCNEKDGLTAGVKCSDCGWHLQEPEVIPAGHKDTDGDNLCDACGASMCTHEGIVETIEAVAATCTETGLSEGSRCSNCGKILVEQTVIEATGHTEVAGEAKAPTCTATGLTEGSYCSVCGDTIIPQEVVAMIDHSYVNDVCSVCGDKCQTYKKVTETPADWSGTYIIVYEAEGRVFNGSLSELDIANNNKIATITDGKIKVSETYAFTIAAIDGGYSIQSYSGKYIGRTDDSNGFNENSTKTYVNTISLDNEGNIVIAGEMGAVLRYNTSSNNERFRYYMGTQEPIALYKLSDPEPEFITFGLTLNKGVTVRVKYNIPESWLAANPNATLAFIDSEGNIISGGERTPASGENIYSIDLTPGVIGNALYLSLFDSNGVSVSSQDVSVASYIDKVKAAGADGLKMTEEKYALLIDLLDSLSVYGNAANSATEGSLSESFDGVAAPEINDSAKNILGNASASLGESASVKFTVNTANIEDMAAYTLSASLAGNDIIKAQLLSSYITAEGKIVISGIFPANFGDTIIISISDENGVVSSVSFTFNSYLKLLYDYAVSNGDQALQNLTVATYLYGQAAKGYSGK